jgi:7,8-dihydropterin-6-yl-methyl-4-(beta-D-ribofuranosyl)aminobenzene 5'-phosphate synthase
MSVELMILMDGGSDASAGQGLSILIRGPGRTMLFDCGASAEALAPCMGQFGLSPSSLSGAIISHGHSNHTGGLAALASSRPEGTEVFLHAGAFSRRWVDRPGSSLTEISCPYTAARLSDAGFRLRWVQAPEMIEDWLILSGPIGGPPANDPTYVVRKGEELVVDNFEDEIFVLLRGSSGWVVLTGCCHRGLRNTLRCARFLAHEEPVSAVIGGLHLGGATPAQLEEAIDHVRQAPDMTLYPCHCTGLDVIEYLRAQLPNQVKTVGPGAKIVL